MMVSSWFFNENFNGVSDDFLDTVKFFDFQLDDVDGNTEDWAAQFQSLGPPPSDILDVFSTAPQSKVCSDPPDHQKSNSVLFGESALLKPMLGTGSGLFHTFSPISVLEGSNTCPVENEKTLDLKTAFPVKRARSKRRRPLFFNPWLAISVVPPPRKRYHSLSGRNFKFVDITETPFPVKRKQQRIDPSVLETSEMKKHPPQQPVLTRKCTHCETTKTPQWREGPLGPKTLCNACGVRYRTGRLFPEYRPAASPTFVESLHSNSHKKVVEMRRAKHSTT